MTTYSVTQQANIAQIVAALGIIVRIFSDSASVTPEEWQIVGIAIVGLVTAGLSYLNRYGKGNVNALGKRV